MRIVSCLGATFSLTTALFLSAAASPLAAAQPIAHASAPSAVVYVAGGGACRQRCMSQYTCVGPFSTLKEQCLKDRRACIAACK